MVAKQKSKTKPKLTDKEQSERFKETARTLGVDNREAGETFETAIKKLLPSKARINRRSA
jgi:hypothetical protein